MGWRNFWAAFSTAAQLDTILRAIAVHNAASRPGNEVLVVAFAAVKAGYEQPTMRGKFSIILGSHCGIGALGLREGICIRAAGAAFMARLGPLAPTFDALVATPQARTLDDGVGDDCCGGTALACAARAFEWAI